MADEHRRLRLAGEFIARIKRPVGRRARDGHSGYTVLDAHGKGMGFVRFNQRGDVTAYIFSDDKKPDPEGRFKPQPKNPKDRHYIFADDDDEAQKYALRAMERVFDQRQGRV